MRPGVLHRVLRGHRAAWSRAQFLYILHFGILLVLAGSRILLSGAAAAVVWALAAIACVWAGNLTLQLHGGVCLTLAVASSGALNQAGNLILGHAVWPGDHPVFIIGGALVAVLCYIRTGPHSPVFRICMAALPVWLLAGISAGLLTSIYHAAFGPSANQDYCATLRTCVLAAGSLGLACAGARGRFAEMSYLIYPTMLLGAYRLLMVDLRQDTKAAFVLSLLAYGIALIALSKLYRANSAAGSSDS